MKTKILSIGLLGVVLTAAGVVSAGMKGSYPVSIGSNYASGSLGSVRNSTDSTQFMDIITQENWAWFAFVDSTGKYAGCTTTDVSRIALARSVNQSSYVYVQWDSSSTCTSVSVRQGSYFETPVR